MNFVFDIDGTTSFNGMVIEPAIEREIYALLREGHRVVFCLRSTGARYSAHAL